MLDKVYNIRWDNQVWHNSLSRHRVVRRLARRYKQPRHSLPQGGAARCVDSKGR